MKLDYAGNIFEKYSIIKFHENTSCGSRVVNADGQINGHNGVNSRFSQFCKTLKITNKIFLGDIKIFIRFYALRISSLLASRLFLKPINFMLQIKIASLRCK
jgi:hypothetical protein